MADHIRQQIRERIATNVTGLTTTGSRVYQSRVYPMASANMPGLLVYSTSEDSEIDAMGATGVLNRVLNISIEGYVKTITEFDDKIDDICKEVETAMAGDQKVNGLAKNSFLQSTEIEFSGDGDQPIGVVTLNYVVQYRTATNAPDAAL
tara:strand:- start:466 stop:912 length:447 start_codon:yes stop_codon:yes gene_type:complete